MFFVILMNINASLVKKERRDQKREREKEGERGARGREREKEKTHRRHRQDDLPQPFSYVLLFFPSSFPSSRFIYRRGSFRPSFSLFLSRSLSLPSLVFLGILFACGLVTAGRGESRGLAVNPLYVGIQISSACARNIRSPPSPPARRPCHPSCRRKEMSPRLPLTGFVTARDRADSKVKYVRSSSSFSSPFCDKLCGKYNIDVAYRVCR